MKMESFRRKQTKRILYATIKIILFTVLSAILLFPQIYFAGCSHILDFF